MTKLGLLMEGFVARARESTVPPLKGPVKVSEDDRLPINPIERWVFEDKKRLRKIFVFKGMEQRNLFLAQLLQYEEYTTHTAEIKIVKNSVELVVWTKDADTVTDLDKTYAKTADELYKDVCFIPAHGYR